MEHWGAACPSGSFDFFFFYETQLLLASVLTKGFPVWLLLTGALIGPDFFHLMMDCAPGNFESFNIFLARLSASTSQHSSFLRSNEGFMNFLLCTEPEGHDEDRCENPKCLYSPWSRDRVPPGVVKSIDVPRPVVPNIFFGLGSQFDITHFWRPQKFFFRIFSKSFARLKTIEQTKFQTVNYCNNSI